MKNYFVMGIGICKILFICASSFIDNYLLIFCFLLLVIEHWISNKLINEGDENEYNFVIAFLMKAKKWVLNIEQCIMCSQCLY